MSRKDYVALAEAFNHSRPFIRTGTEAEDEAMLAQWRNDVRAVAVVLKHDNPQFNHAKFLAAAGVEVVAA